jgi:hypothetical protein
MEINFKETLFSIESRNRKCNDCGDDGVKYVSINNGITLCELCAQIHKNFGYQISYLRSIDDEFDDYLMGFFIYGGNKKFRRTLKQMGVNLDQKKGNLYRTYGVDFYRRNLKSIVKGNSQLDKDYVNPNEVMKTESNIFPEFQNYIINQNNNFYPSQNYNGNDINYNNDINGINELQNLGLNIDLNYNNIINNPIDNDLKNPELNNNEIQINPVKDKKLESVQSPEDKNTNEEDKKAEEGNNSNKVSVNVDDDEDSADRRIKKVMNLSIKGAKKLGSLMKVGGIKGYELAKKYGKSSFKLTKKYIKQNVPYFNKNKNNPSNPSNDDENNKNK